MVDLQISTCATGLAIPSVRTPSRPGSPPDDDSGVSTVFGALTVALLIVVTAVAIRLGGAMIARHQAETAADLGALAGAVHALEGQVAACSAASAVVTANHGSLTACTLDGLDLRVEVSAPAPTWGQNASARARAGPVTTA